MTGWQRGFQGIMKFAAKHDCPLPFRNKRLHMPLDAVARLDELLITGRKTCAAKTLAVFTKSRAGNHRHFFRLQQADGKIFFGQPGHGNIRKRAEDGISNRFH